VRELVDDAFQVAVAGHLQTVPAPPDVILTAAVTVSIAQAAVTAFLVTMTRVTPTMQAGLSDHVWSIEEIVALLD
jgi:hypothetical protein